MTKPLVFNYQHYETLRDVATDLAGENEELRKKVDHQMWEVMKVKGENTTLRCELETTKSKYETATRIIDIQRDIIAEYHKTFKLQEAELAKLRKELCT